MANKTSGVSFSAHEKLSIARQLLTDLGVNRIEIASARVSGGEYDAVKLTVRWASERAGYLSSWKYSVLWMAILP